MGDTNCNMNQWQGWISLLISDDEIFVRNIDITMVLMPKYESWWQWGLKRWWKLYGWALIAFGIYKHGLHPDMA